MNQLSEAGLSGQIRTYTYDAGNRLTSKSYSDTTQAANLFYDEPSVTLNGNIYTLTNTKGRLSRTSSGSAETVYSYDSAGRVTDHWQCPIGCGAQFYPSINYGYDLAGDTASWSHPAGFTITHGINTAQQITQITSTLNDLTHPPTLATLTYAPHGAISTLVNGCAGTGCVNIKETYGYNNRLQPFWVQLGTSAAPSANACLVYNYYSVANPTSCAIPGQGTGNNGNVMGYLYQDTTNPGLGHTASYTYDALNRLTNSVATGSSTHNLTFGYDRFGNMTCVLYAQTQGLCPSWGYNALTNRITNTGFNYDAAGNLTQDGTHTYQYDAESRMITVDTGTTATYTYNALGQRVEKKLGTAYTEILYSASGEPVGEHNRTIWTLSVVPLGGRHLAHYNYQDGKTYFVHGNRLGSTNQFFNSLKDFWHDRISAYQEQL